MRDERRNYVVAGGFVVAMLATLLFWIWRLSGPTGATEPYHVLYDRVHGLKPGTEVLLDGYRVGRVEGIGPAEPGAERRFRVDLQVARAWAIPEDSRARVLQGLFSQVLVDVRSGRSATPIPPGGRIPSEESSDVFADVQSVARRFDDALEELRPVIEGVAKGGPEILENLRSLTSDLDRASEQLAAVLSPENAERVGHTLENAEAASKDLAELTRSLEATRRSLDAVVARVGELVEKDRGDLSVAARDLNHSLAAVARHIDAIAADLERSSRNLAEFTRQVRENPGVVVRGRERSGDGAAP